MQPPPPPPPTPPHTHTHTLVGTAWLAVPHSLPTFASPLASCLWPASWPCLEHLAGPCLAVWVPGPVWPWCRIPQGPFRTPPPQASTSYRSPLSRAPTRSATSGATSRAGPRGASKSLPRWASPSAAANEAHALGSLAMVLTRSDVHKRGAVLSLRCECGLLPGSWTPGLLGPHNRRLAPTRPADREPGCAAQRG